MFVYDVAFDPEPLARFTVILDRPAAATSVALLPVGKTDGYASTAAGACEVLIGDRPVVSGGVNSAHARAPGIGPRQS